MAAPQQRVNELVQASKASTSILAVTLG